MLETALGEAATVLDVGCGSDSPIRRFRRQPHFSVGVDIFEPSIKKSRAAGIHDEYVQADVVAIGDLFRPDSFDACAAFDVIEHLDESDALHTLAAMERIARRRVVVLAPNGFIDQDEIDGNPWQRHRSAWSARKLRDRGFDVYGVHGLRGIRGEKAKIRRRPMACWELAADLSQPIVYRYPRLAFHLLAVKSLA